MKQLIAPSDTPSVPIESDYAQMLDQALYDLRQLGQPHNTAFDVGQYIGRLSKVWVPSYEPVYDAYALGIANPRKPYVHVPEHVGPYRFGWLIPDTEWLVTDDKAAFLQPLQLEHRRYIVTGPEIAFEAWEDHGVELAIVATSLTRMCAEVVAARHHRLRAA